MMLIPYGESLDCSCSPTSATGAAINSAGTSYAPTTFTYNADGTIGYTGSASVNTPVPVNSASYPAFREY